MTIPKIDESKLSKPDTKAGQPATGRPLATAEMAALKRRARRRTSLDTLRVWSGNEAPTLEQLVAAVPPINGLAALIDDMDDVEKRR